MNSSYFILKYMNKYLVTKNKYISLKKGGTLKLEDMPQLCFGTVQSNLENTLPNALKKGIRHIDGADIYGYSDYRNIIKENLKTVLRNELWITWKSDRITIDNIQKSIIDLDCQYIDLFLIHHYNYYDNDFLILQEAQKLGLIRYFGVSNCEDIEKMKELKSKYNIYANQIQARPPNGTIYGIKEMSSDFIEQCNAINVHIMLFGTISGFTNSEILSTYLLENINNINLYYR